MANSKYKEILEQSSVPNKVWKTALYLRLSRDDGTETESNSIASQREILKEYLKRCPDMELVDIYSKVEPERRLDGIKKWKRAIVMLAGVTLNFVLGFILLIVFFTTTTFATMYDNSVVVSENSIAQQAGWESEDIIYTSSFKIDNLMEEEKVYDSSDITHNLYTSVVELSNYTPTSDKDIAHYTLVTSENKTIKFDLVPNLNQETNTYSF